MQRGVAREVGIPGVGRLAVVPHRGFDLQPAARGQPLAPGQQRNPEDEYRWLIQLRPQSSGLGNVPQPDYRAGTSIFIYKL